MEIEFIDNPESIFKTVPDYSGWEMTVLDTGQIVPVLWEFHEGIYTVEIDLLMDGLDFIGLTVTSQYKSGIRANLKKISVA